MLGDSLNPSRHTRSPGQFYYLPSGENAVFEKNAIFLHTNFFVLICSEKTCFWFCFLTGMMQKVPLTNFPAPPSLASENDFFKKIKKFFHTSYHWDNTFMHFSKYDIPFKSALKKTFSQESLTIIFVAFFAKLQVCFLTVIELYKFKFYKFQISEIYRRY